MKDLTSRTINRIERQRTQENVSINRAIDSTATALTTADEMLVDENKFYQIIKIDLGIESKANVLRCIKKLEQREDVLMAFPNYIYEAAATPNDELYSSQWALSKIKLPDAWNITTGSNSVKVGVIDSGIDGDHPDLVNRVNTSLSKDFTGGNSPLTDEGGHGTVVAGVIGAQGNNSEGVTGTCWNVSLVSLKAAVKTGTHCTMSYDCLADAIDYATDKNIPIINCSYGGPNNLDKVRVALGKYKGLFVCAAGNQAQDITNVATYPIDYDYSNTIVVAGTNSSDVLYTVPSTGKGSNYSSTKVDLAAPGESIDSTSHTGDYSSPTGTSMAAPYVAGVAALLKSKYPTMSTRTIKWYITTYVDKVSALSGKVSTGGRLNAYKALSNVRQYTVKYDANGGTGTMADTTVIYNNYTPLRKNQFTNNGAEFLGWYAQRKTDNKWYYTNGTNSGWYLEDDQPDGYYKYLYSDEHTVFNTTSTNGGIVTMYAQWSILYTISFNGKTGIGSMQDISVQYGVEFELPSNTFTKEGYYFDYWFAKKATGETYCVGASGSGWYQIDEKPSGYVRKSFADKAYIYDMTMTDVVHGDTITMYAHWEPNAGELGDVNMDGNINIKDVTLVQKHVAELVTLTNDQLYIADVNYDGNVNTPDATRIQKYSNGLIEYWDE